MLPRRRVVAHKAIEEGAIGLLVTLVGQAIVYAVVGLRGSFLRYWLVYWLVQQSGVALAYVCASLAPNMDAANTLLPVYNTCQLLFSGLLIRRKDIAPGWAWWPHTLFVRYGWQAQLMNHFGRNREPPPLSIRRRGRPWASRRVTARTDSIGARTSDTSSCAGSVGSRSRASYSRKSDTGNGEYETMKR